MSLEISEIKIGESYHLKEALHDLSIGSYGISTLEELLLELCKEISKLKKQNSRLRNLINKEE